MKKATLGPSSWTDKHTRVFLALKKALTPEPVLRGLKWDGTPFVVTTDGCKEGFGAVLTQQFSTTLPNRITVQKMHPIAFASKHTSSTEQKYEPFILKFAACKFVFDMFNDVIWGFLVELETDCQALRDVLWSEKLNVAHTRWRDRILAHHIIDIRHIPGKINVVVDGLSRHNKDRERIEGDGSKWTVSEDWEASRGIVNNIWSTEVLANPTASAL